MTIKNIYYTSTFEKHFRKLPNSVKNQAFKKEVIFRNNPLDDSLKAHPLSGKLKGYYSFSINYHYRILFVFEEETDSVTFIDVGTHSIYR